MILLIRPENDSQRIAPDFQNLGYKVIISPLLKIHSHKVILPQYDAICLSSKNAIPALKEVSKKTPLYCVGDHTSKTLKELGFETIITAPTALDLLKALRNKKSLGKVLYLAGEVSTLDFSDHLPQCYKLICYDAVAQEDFSPESFKALQEKSITHIPLYSVRSFKILNQLLVKNKIDLKGIRILALSKDIAQQAKGLDFKEVLIARTPTHQALINLL
ncbi:MAG TPA: hypothetical protein DD412_04195 [Holosporales bacterium]|nr:hypothetical protein [Holosporales bacterium]